MVGRKRIVRKTTPVDDPTILSEWRQMEAYAVDHLGLPEYRAHELIAQRYLVSRSTVRRHLSGFPSGQNPRSRSYEEQAKSPRYLTQQRIKADFKNNPDRYLAPCYDTAEQAMPLDELSVRVHERWGYLPRLKTLERIAHEGSYRTGAEALQEVVPTTNPPTYRLAPNVSRTLRKA